MPVRQQVFGWLMLMSACTSHTSTSVDQLHDASDESGEGPAPTLSSPTHLIGVSLSVSATDEGVRLVADRFLRRELSSFGGIEFVPVSEVVHVHLAMSENFQPAKGWSFACSVFGIPASPAATFPGASVLNGIDYTEYGAFRIDDLNRTCQEIAHWINYRAFDPIRKALPADRPRKND